jgi:uncharacterized membrane protein YtjA (UPF0391 family)
MDGASGSSEASWPALAAACNEPASCEFTEDRRPRRNPMLKWALIFLVISIITGLLGFTGISAATAGIAKILFYIFIVVTLVVVIVAFAIGQAVF